VCFILALLGRRPDSPLVLAANRDERRDRPSRPPFRWPDRAIWAGRDEVAGGTWLGVNEGGLLVAITNRRDGAADPSLPSRGRLCLDLLDQPSTAAAAAALTARLAARRHNPFNLLCADRRGGWVASWRGQPRTLGPGAHVLTNRGELDDRALPVVARALDLLDAIDTAAPLADLLPALGRLCADTAGPDPICRLGGDRGTVSSSLVALDADGRLAAYWHADGPPAEAPYRSILPMAAAR